MPDKFLLDANAIVNAAFIPQSWSRLAINTALGAKAAIYIGEATLREAMDAAQRTASQLGKAADPRPVIEGYVQQIKPMFIVADKGIGVPKKIPRNDATVFAEAQTCGAELLTSDAELWLACRDAKPPAVLPLEVIRRYNGPALGTTIFGILQTRDSGSLFVRAYPGGWAHLRTPERFTAMHFPGGVIWVYYDTGKRAWIAEISGYKPLEVPSEVKQGGVETVGLSWRLGEQIVLRTGDAEHPAIVDMKTKLPDNVDGKVQIGGHPSGKHYWNGTIYACVNDDRPIGKDAWRTLKKDRELTPNPFDSDRLRMAIDRVLRS
jgi:hypothetical protein